MHLAPGIIHYYDVKSVLCRNVFAGLVSDAVIPDYDTSARFDLPGTSARCAMSDGDDPLPQARRCIGASSQWASHSC